MYGRNQRVLVGRCRNGTKNDLKIGHMRCNQVSKWRRQIATRREDLLYNSEKEPSWCAPS